MIPAALRARSGRCMTMPICAPTSLPRGRARAEFFSLARYAERVQAMYERLV